MRVAYTQTKPRERKNEKTLLSIKNFAAMSGVEQSTLRYWDDIGLFSPAQRNMDSGYRYYSPEQIILVKFIKVLSSLNVPLKVIADLSENRSPAAMLQIMEQQEIVLDGKLNQLREAFATIHTMRSLIQQGINVPSTSHIAVRRLNDMPLVLGPPNKPWKGEEFYSEFMQYRRYAKENRINQNNPIGGYYESMKHFLETPSVPSRFFTVDSQGSDRRAAGKYLVTHTQGNYGMMNDAPTNLKDFAAQRGLKINGPVYVHYLLDEISMQNPSEYLAQICAALEPAKTSILRKE